MIRPAVLLQVRISAERHPNAGEQVFHAGYGIGIRPGRANNVQAYGSVKEQLHFRRTFRMPCVETEFTHKARTVEMHRNPAPVEFMKNLASLSLAKTAPLDGR